VEIMPVTTITSPLPEHSLRQRDETAVSTSGMDVCRLPASVGTCDLRSGNASRDRPPPVYTAGTNDGRPADAKASIRPWPFTAQDAPPLAWWRILPADHFRDAEHLLVRATLDRLVVMNGNRKWRDALSGDAAAAVGIVIALMPIEQTTLEVDIAMTAVLLCALKHNAAAELVLTVVLDRTALDHPFAAQLAESWRARKWRHLSDRQRLPQAEAGCVTTMGKCNEPAVRGGDRA
jgi:hypothetical protein